MLTRTGGRPGWRLGDGKSARKWEHNMPDGPPCRPRVLPASWWPVGWPHERGSDLLPNPGLPVSDGLGGSEGFCHKRTADIELSIR